MGGGTRGTMPGGGVGFPGGAPFSDHRKLGHDCQHHPRPCVPMDASSSEPVNPHSLQGLLRPGCQMDEPWGFWTTGRPGSDVQSLFWVTSRKLCESSQSPVFPKCLILKLLQAMHDIHRTLTSGVPSLH